MAILGLVAGCRPRPPPELPGEEDLYAYSKAVAARARSLVPEEKALGLFHVGRVHQLFGYEDDALDMYAEVAKLAPSLAKVHMQVGYILAQRTERMYDAIASYRRALEVDPKVAGAHTRIGLVHLHENKLDDSEREFREEIQNGTADENTYYNLGQALALKIQHEEAVQQYQRAIKIDPNMRMAHYGLAQSLTVLGRSAEAENAKKAYRELQQAEDSMTVDPEVGSSNRPNQLKWTSEVWMNAADLLAIGATRTSDAERIAALEKEFLHALHEAARFDRFATAPQMALMSYHAERGEIELAAAACEHLLSLYANKEVIVTAFTLAGRCMEEVKPGEPDSAGRVEQARRLLERIVDLAPAMADAQRELARLYLVHRSDQRELVSAALDHARKSVQAQPNARNYDVLGFALMANGRLQEAVEKLEEGVRANPEDPTLQDRLARLLERYRP